MTQSTPDLDDDGPNPLPPALDTAATVSSRSAIPADEDAHQGGPSDDEDHRPCRAQNDRPARSSRDDSKAIGIMERPGEREPRSMPEDILPGARVITPESSAPIVVNEAPDDGQPPSASSPRTLATRSLAERGPVRVTPPSDADSSADRFAGYQRCVHDSPLGRPGASWRAIRPKCRSTSRFAGPSSDASATADSAVVTLTSTTTAAKPGPISAARADHDRRSTMR